MEEVVEEGRVTSAEAVSCTRLSQSQNASLCERFVSNAHHRLKKKRPRKGAGTLMVPIEGSGWRCRRRGRGKGTGLAGGVPNRRGTVFSCGKENVRALTRRLLLAASNGLLGRSGSSPSRTNHQALTLVLKGQTRLRVRQCSAAQEYLQKETSKATNLSPWAIK